MSRLPSDEWAVRVHEEVHARLAELKASGNGHVARRVVERLHRLADDPLRPRPGLDIRRLSGVDDPIYRVRVGSWRVLYEVDRDDRIVYVTTVAHRSGAYG